MKTLLNADQKEHLEAFNKFVVLDKQKILEFITKHYKGAGHYFFNELINDLEHGMYSELSEKLLLFGNISEKDKQRIFFYEELEGMSDDEIVSLFNQDFENKHLLILYYYKNRLLGFDVDEIKDVFGVSDDYLKEKFALYFATRKPSM